MSDIPDLSWPECAVHLCDNRVNPKRIALGHFTCVEFHSHSKTLPAGTTLIPMPKSNTVLGPSKDLVGIAGSHKGSTLSDMGTPTGRVPGRHPLPHNLPPSPRRPSLEQSVKNLQRDLVPTVVGLSRLATRRLYSARDSLGGPVIRSPDNSNEAGLNELYCFSLVRSRTEPAYLTNMGRRLWETLHRINAAKELVKLEDYL